MAETSTISLDQGMVNGGFRMEDESHRLYMSSWYFNHKLPLPQQLYIAIASISTNPMPKMIGRFVFSSQFLSVLHPLKT
ncbi:hypothetical protein ZIOFF_054140 [Zingiber officinale]|uniref:Uncharacterized protein n=1 Tax=Zingiber officinale TaxID=94328 RepID=A0A8J5F8Z1_ZINOF|nr:hypothetical protein ZIOFF_054140 [Zingiber officinale]